MNGGMTRVVHSFFTYAAKPTGVVSIRVSFHPASAAMRRISSNGYARLISIPRNVSIMNLRSNPFNHHDGEGSYRPRRLLSFAFGRFSSRGVFRDDPDATGSVPGSSANCNRIC